MSVVCLLEGVALSTGTSLSTTGPATPRNTGPVTPPWPAPRGMARARPATRACTHVHNTHACAQAYTRTNIHAYTRTLNTYK